MIKFILIVVVVAFVFIALKSNIHIKWNSFFKKGFKKLDNLFGVVCYCAKQGKGKTYCAVEFCEEQQRKNNVEIITNVFSYFEFLKKNNRSCRFEKSLKNIIEYVNDLDTFSHPVIIFFDEIFTSFNKSGVLKKDLISFLSQLRKRKILLITTCQEWSEIHITFRRYVRFQVIPNMFPMPIFNTALIIKSVNDGDLIHWSQEDQDFIAPTIEKSFSKASLDTVNKYDTFETISVSNDDFNSHK